MKSLSAIFFILFSLILINNRLISAGQFNNEPDISTDIKQQIEMLRSEDSRVRCEAAQKLAAMGEEAKLAVPKLIEMLADTSYVIYQQEGKIISSTSVDKEALKALISIGKFAVEPLIKAVKSNNIDVRRNATEALGKIKNSLAVDSLITALNDEDAYVRRNAAIALGDIGDQRAVISLIAALDDKKTFVENASLEALKKIMHGIRENNGAASLSDFIKYDNIIVRELVIDEIKHEKTGKAAELLILAMKDANPGIQKKAVNAILNIGNPAAEPLINALNNEDIDTRIYAAIILGDLQDKRAVESLINSLKYESKDNLLLAERLRIESALALGKIGDARSIEPLIKIIKGKEVRLQEAAVNALTEIGEPAVEPLISLIKSKNFISARINAVIILGDIKDTRAVDPIINALLIDAYENTSWMFRAEAIRALAKIGDSRAIEPLKIMLNDHVTYIRNMADWALDVIQNRKQL